MTMEGAPLSAAAFEQAVSPTSAQMRDLHRFRLRLTETNQSMNLVGPSVLGDFWGRHVLDSAQLLHVEHSALRWADVGAGAGFPGVVLAILLKGQAGAMVHLVESMAKRVGFLEAIVGDLDLPAKVHHGRAEVIEPPDVDVVTARACAPLPRLFEYTSTFFRRGATGLFLKGKGVEAELTEARKSWKFRVELMESRSDPSGRIVRVEGLSRV